jgi:DNA polymerase-3 subunit gamma/tau
MADYIVSARKYRPDNFDAVVGQRSITATLKSAISTNRVAQAYLFCGPRGVGKTTCARIFAKTINCLNIGKNFEACNQCESCQSFNQNRSFNIHELDAASNNSVEDIRLLIEKVRIPPQISRYSVYIIDEVHMLSQSAFNAFLKTLEEPPKHAIFILATTEKHKILPTILSRCQIFDFNRIKISDISEYLAEIAKKEKIEYETDALNIIAQKADGAMRDALSIFDQIVSFSKNKISYQEVIENLNILDYDYYFKLTNYFLQGEVASALTLFDEILTRGFDAHNFINSLCRHFRDLLVCKSEETLPLLEVGDSLKKRYLEQSRECPNDLLFSWLEICSTYDISFKSSKNQRLHIELSLIKLCNQSQKKNWDIKADDSLLLPSPEEARQKVSPNKSPSSSEADKPIKKSEAQGKAESQKDHETPPVKYLKSSTPSIKNALNSVDVRPAEKNEDIPEDEDMLDMEDEPDLLSDPDEISSIGQEDLLIYWEEHIAGLKTEKSRMYNVLSSQKPNLTDNTTLEVRFRNHAQIDEFKQNIKPSLIANLRKSLKNDHLEIREVMQDEEHQTDKKYYTDTDKLKYMMEKNPALQKLRQEFNLDLE